MHPLVVHRSGALCVGVVCPSVRACMFAWSTAGCDELAGLQAKQENKTAFGEHLSVAVLLVHVDSAKKLPVSVAFTPAMTRDAILTCAEKPI